MHACRNNKFASRLRVKIHHVLNAKRTCSRCDVGQLKAKQPAGLQRLNPPGFSLGVLIFHLIIRSLLIPSPAINTRQLPPEESRLTCVFCSFSFSFSLSEETHHVKIQPLPVQTAAAKYSL